MIVSKNERLRQITTKNKPYFGNFRIDEVFAVKNILNKVGNFIFAKKLKVCL